MYSEDFSINKKPSSYTEAALSMLTCCMQKLTAEIITNTNKTQSWIDAMTSNVMGLGETIYKIENNKFIEDNEDIVIDMIED